MDTPTLLGSYIYTRICSLGYGLDNQGLISSRGSHYVQTVMESIRPIIHCEPGASSPEYVGQGVKLTTHLHVVSRLRMCGAILSIHPYVFVV